MLGLDEIDVTACIEPDPEEILETERYIDSLPPDNMLHAYMAELKRVPAMSPEEESLLLEKMRLGDSEAKNHIAEANLLRVVCVARCFSGRGASTEELVHEGNVELINALDEYDASFGSDLHEYLVFRLSEALKRHLGSMCVSYKIPTELVNRLNTVSKCYQRFLRERGYSPTVQELAMETGYEEDNIGEMLKILDIPAAHEPPEL